MDVGIVFLERHRGSERGDHMGKTTIYLNKEAEENFRRAKEYDEGYSLSNATADGLKAFVMSMDIKTKGMNEIIILDGEEDHVSGQTFGRRVKFIGKKLSAVGWDVGPNTDEQRVLYYTRKGKYIVQFVERDGDGVRRSTFKKYEALKELHSAGLPPALLAQAETVPGELCEELDV